MDEQIESTDPHEPPAATEPPAPSPLSVAPAWHTAVLIVAVLAVAIQQSLQGPAGLGAVHRLATYGMAVVMDVLLIAWIFFGLWLRKLSVRSLLGNFAFSFRSILSDLGVAALFWIAAMTVLGSCALLWTGVEAVATHQSAAIAQGHLPQPSPSQLDARNTLKALAPSNPTEIAAWIALCLFVGFAEELIFRGYLQRQLIAATRGRVALGLVAAAIVFGVGHSYQGARGVFLIAIYGALFGALAIYRRSLRAGMFAHAWHDMLTGLLLALLKSHHLI